MNAFFVKRWGIGLCLLGFSVLLARADDASDSFLQAYQLVQTGEKLVADNDLQRALLRFREAEVILQKITTGSPDWQPLIVDYRLRRTRESITRLEAQTAGMPPLEEELEGPLPASERERPSQAILPPVVTTTQQTPARKTRVLPPASSDSSPLSKALRELASLKNELSRSKKETAALAKKLEQSAAELNSALTEIDRTKVNVVDLKSQLVQANDTIENIKRDRGDMASIRESRDKETAEFLQRLAQSDADAEVLREENDRLLAKLEAAAQYISSSDTVRSTLLEERTALTKEREELKSAAESANAELETTKADQLAKAKETADEIARLTEANTALEKDIAQARKEGADSDRLKKLAEENESLKEKLAATEKSLKEGGGQEAVVVALRSELNSVNDRLLEAQAQLSQRDEKIDQLASQLDEVSGELARLKLVPEPRKEEEQLLAENDLLRGIILRQIKQQNRRDEAMQDVEKELAGMKIESESLQSRLAILGAPVLELTPEERSLFKAPVSLLTEKEPARMEVDLAITQPTSEEASRNIIEMSPQGADALTDTTRELVRKAQERFNEKDYLGAERIYQDIVSTTPENYFVLSNLGAVQIEAGKLSAAEVALQKAVSISPGDYFAHAHLGIAFSRQGRFDEARASLSKAIELNPSDAIAHNYLGVCLAQQGNRDQAEEELKKAIDLDANYANAHFNLAVLYATTKPPAFDLAKQHYKLATELGASRDSSLEQIIQ